MTEPDGHDERSENALAEYETQPVVPPDARTAAVDHAAMANGQPDGRAEAPGRHGEESDCHRAVSGQLQRRLEAVRQSYTGSSAENVARRLGALDIINRGMLVAAILLLCLFPFLIVVTSLAGRSAVPGLVRRLGLNHEAATDLAKLFASSTTTSAAVSGSGYVFFVLGGIAAASAIQELYERAFGVEHRGLRDLPRRLIWLGVTMGASFVAGLAGPSLRSLGGPVLLALVALIAFTIYWWFTMWLLLARRVSVRDTFPAAVATSLFWIGMEVCFSLFFSSTVISNYDKYGPIGVVISLMSWLIAIGVVIILGAVVGIVWRERKLSFRAALGRLAGRSRHRFP